MIVVIGHLSIFVIAARTAGVTTSTASMIPLAVLVLLATTLPLSIGGWGPREGVAAWAFAAAGLGADQGVAAATAYGVMAFAATLERQSRPDGFGRQFAAIVASPDRTPGLRALDLPTLVIHGADDPLVDRSGGEATAKAVPGAEMLMVPGMGHNLPEPLWPEIVDAIAANAGRAKALA